MSIDTGDLLKPAATRKPGDFERNHMGAPYVNHPTDLKKDGTPRRVVYGRPSSFGSALDNAYNLVKWKERQLLLGAWSVMDDEYKAHPGPFDYTERDYLDGLAARCHQAAGSSLAADRGTHIHWLLEEWDHGNILEDNIINRGAFLGIPHALQGRIVDQWQDFRRGLGVTALAIEATVVHDGWRLAGTLDRLDVADRNILTGLGVIPAGVPFIGDIKTGGLTLGNDGQPNYWVKYPVQLAAYADGVPYDVDTDKRTPWADPAVHRDIALIYHYDLARALNGEQVDWQAIPVNLAAGREGGNLCREAADFGKRRDLFLMPKIADGEGDSRLEIVPPDEGVWHPTDGTVEPSPSAPIAPVPDAGVEPASGIGAATTVPLVDDFHIAISDGRRGTVTVPCSRSWLQNRVMDLIYQGHEPVLRRMWPAGVPPLSVEGHTVDQLTALFHMIRRVEAEVGAPFDPEPAPVKIAEGEVDVCANVSASPSALPDDGGPVAPDAMQALKDRMLALPDNRIVELAAIAREANEAGRPISVQQKPCIRRWEIARALVIWAESSYNVDDLWLALAGVGTFDQVTQDFDSVGELISTFTIDQALQLADLLQPF